jgi:cation:H+ antiporter
MSVPVAVTAFLAGALVSLATSWFLVSRLERVGERLGFSEALLGIVAALAADAPEVTAAVAAIAGHQQRLGAGVVIGSNVFNLAALLGLGAVVAGRIRLHRRVVILGGAVAMMVAFTTMAVVTGLLPPAVCCGLCLVVVALYATVLGAGPRGTGRLRLPSGWTAWLKAAVAEEEMELAEAIRPRRARGRDAVAAVAALIVVVGASVLMERAASSLGTRFAVPEIVVGGLVLAAVTSLPNAVAAVYLAARDRGSASFSTALNSNTLNVAFGLLIPAVIVGIGPPVGVATLVAAWYTGLTVVMLAFAYYDHGIGRGTGVLIIVAYLIFAGSLLAPAGAVGVQSWIAAATAVVAALVFAGRLMSGRHRGRGGQEPEPSPRPPAQGQSGAA